MPNPKISSKSAILDRMRDFAKNGYARGANPRATGGANGADRLDDGWVDFAFNPDGTNHSGRPNRSVPSLEEVSSDDGGTSGSDTKQANLEVKPPTLKPKPKSLEERARELAWQINAQAEASKTWPTAINPGIDQDHGYAISHEGAPPMSATPLSHTGTSGAPAMQASPGTAPSPAAPPMAPSAPPPTQAARPRPMMRPKTLEEQADEMARAIAEEHKAAMARPTAVNAEADRSLAAKMQQPSPDDRETLLYRK